MVIHVKLKYIVLYFKIIIIIGDPMSIIWGSSLKTLRFPIQIFGSPIKALGLP